MELLDDEGLVTLGQLERWPQVLSHCPGHHLADEGIEKLLVVFPRSKPRKICDTEESQV